jgi:hypothetical protein
MSKYSYSIEVLNLVISACNLNELNTVSGALCRELSLYKQKEIIELVSLVRERHKELTGMPNSSRLNYQQDYKLSSSFS